MAQLTNQWEPKEGWNAALSEKDRTYCASLVVFFKKTLSEAAASRAAHMIVFKQKYHGLVYSEEQEAFLSKHLLRFTRSRFTRSVKA